MATGLQQVSQLCSNYTALPFERKCYRGNETEAARWDTDVRGIELLECAFIPNNCVSESFLHFYLKKNKAKYINVNMWPSAKPGEYAITKQPCLLESGLLLTRKCIYNSKNYSVNWEEGEKYKNVKCLRSIEQRLITFQLTTLLKAAKINKETVAQLSEILSQPNTLRIAADLAISTSILKAITSRDKSPELLPKVLQATNLLMQSNNNAVDTSKKIDTPTILLNTIETYLDGMADVVMQDCSIIPTGVNKIQENIASVFYINPLCSNVTGIAVYTKKQSEDTSTTYDNVTNTHFRYIYFNESQENIANEPYLEVASFFSHDVWQLLQIEASERVKVIRISLYRNKNFFVRNEAKEFIPESMIMKMSLIGYTDEFPGFVPMIFGGDYENSKKEPQCGTYNYYEDWKKSEPSEFYTKYAAICKITRCTSFAALVGINDKPANDAELAILTIAIGYTEEIISIGGCALSLFGLFCIWLTAICFKQWRLKSSNVLLFNICLVLTLIMVYFVVINATELLEVKDIVHCYAEGAILQYLVLVLFLWMLISAILQYRCYVIVIVPDPSFREMKMYIAAAWLIPFIPTTLVVLCDADSYLPISENGDAIATFCYPSGKSFYFAIFLPLCVVFVVNFSVFVYIFHSLRQSLSKFNRSQDRKNFIRRLKLGILLFFLLGITWLFGISAHIFKSQLLSFAFSLTSTLQGFVLFIYFVVFDESARKSWTHCCGGKDYNGIEKMSLTSFTYSGRRNSRTTI
uniref:G-protein coupled receptors family 2 profile 2 domain-containing protein n=1 Tax=Stomoxys calcitrans TaxID=35570 RepID=A0A1I8NRW4_STOCA